MKFSLKTFLITLCVGGAAVGVMGKLLLESPEVFLRILTLAATVGPFLLAVGTIIWIGLRGKRQWKLVGWGTFLLLLPPTVFVGMQILWPSGNPLRVLSTRRLIERRLPNQLDEPWVWNELEYRLGKGSLSRDEVEDAFRALTAHLNQARPSGWSPQTLPWQHGFVAAAIQAKLVSVADVVDLCDAFFGPNPVVRAIPPVAAGQRGFNVNIDYGNPFSRISGLGVELLWDVKRVLLDGSPMKITQMNLFGEHGSTYCEGQLTPGDHEVQIEVECAYVDESKLTGLKAGQLPVSRWPRARKRWTTTVTVPVKVQPAANK
jgi:hypothetical protein